MEYVVFDLEWNMPSPGCKVPADIRKRIPYEITEIGAVRLDDRFIDRDDFRACIRPRIYQNLNPWVAHITKQRFSELQRSGEAFETVARRFMRWCGGPFVFCSWSENDLEPLKQNLAFYGLPSRLPERCLDVQHLFHELADPDGTQRSVGYAVEQLNIAVPEGRSFHNAGDDAWFTGAILRALMQSPDTHRLLGSRTPREARQALIRRFSYDPNINRKSVLKLPALGLPDGDAFLPAPDQISLTCPACDAPLKALKPWKQKAKSIVATFQCPTHGVVSAKVNRWKNRKGEVRRSLTLQIPKYGHS